MKSEKYSQQDSGKKDGSDQNVQFTLLEGLRLIYTFYTRTNYIRTRRHDKIKTNFKAAPPSKSFMLKYP